MSTREKIIDDVARFAGEAVGLMSGFAGQAKTVVRNRVDEIAHSIDLVPREDFERMESVLLKTRAELDEVKARLESLEAKLSSEKIVKK